MTFEESLQHEIDAMILLSDLHGWRTIKTPRYARVDGLVLNHDGDMLAVYEFKSRELTLDELATMGTYLVTHQKITRRVRCRPRAGRSVCFNRLPHWFGKHRVVQNRRRRRVVVD
jgi:hypothetical protein